MCIWTLMEFIRFHIARDSKLIAWFQNELRKWLWCHQQKVQVLIWSLFVDIEGILPKGPYLPCVSMAGGALLAGYQRYRPFGSSYVTLCAKWLSKTNTLSKRLGHKIKKVLSMCESKKTLQSMLCPLSIFLTHEYFCPTQVLNITSHTKHWL